MLAAALLALALAAPATPPVPTGGPPRAVTGLLPAGRTLVESRQADLDGDGTAEWVLVARYQHPTRPDRGPASPEWRAGMLVETRVTHELLVAGLVAGRWVIRYQAELRGNERQALLVERLASPTAGRGRFPVVVTGARACLTSCGPVELHLVTWDPRTHAFSGTTEAGVEFAQLSRSRGVLELWFADRLPGEAMCCPSGYTIARKAMLGPQVETLERAWVPAERMRKVLPPGALIVYSEWSQAGVRPGAASGIRPPCPSS